MFVLTTAVSRRHRDHTEWVEAIKRTWQGRDGANKSPICSTSRLERESNPPPARSGILARALICCCSHWPCRMPATLRSSTVH